ncbi:MAG: thioredoxin family protein [Actinomycetota bacterium]
MTMIDEVQLQDRLGKGKAIVIDITADWCQPCRAIAPELEKLATEHTGVEFVKIDADANPALLERLGVMGVPTLVHFDGTGQEVARSTGAAPAAALAFRLKLGS